MLEKDQKNRIDIDQLYKLLNVKNANKSINEKG
jgi:hypothetical protein